MKCLWLGVAWGAIAATAGCETTTPPEEFETPGDSADQMLFGMEHTVTVEGVLRANLSADTAYLYEAAQVWELAGHVTVNFFNALGENTSTITSNAGTYNLRTKDMEARGDVVGSTPDGRRLVTTVMRYEKVSDELVGPEFFTFTGPDRDMQGDSFRADPDLTRLRVTGLSGTTPIREPRS